MKTNITGLILDAKNNIEMLGLKSVSVGLTKEDYRFLKHELSADLNIPVPKKITSFMGLSVFNTEESVICGINPFSTESGTVFRGRLFCIRTFLEKNNLTFLDYDSYGYSPEDLKFNRDEINERD